MNVFMKTTTWFVGTKFWSWLTKNFISRLDMRLLGDSKFPMERWYEVEKICQDNCDKMLVFVSYGTKLSSVLVRLVTRSLWTHAGVIQVVDGKVRIIHMESVGLLDQVLLELLKAVDNFAIIEVPMDSEEIYLSRIIMESYIQKKPGYDFRMLLGNIALYCSELIYEMCKSFVCIKPHTEAGRKVFEPQDVYNMGKVLFEHRT